LAGLEADNFIPVPAADPIGFISLTALLGASGILILRRRTRLEPARVPARK
jgi:hypothetical protein